MKEKKEEQNANGGVKFGEKYSLLGCDAAYFEEALRFGETYRFHLQISSYPLCTVCFIRKPFLIKISSVILLFI
jgi:hypothetical protein